MKLLPDYKKLFSLIAILIILAVPIAFSRADTAEEIRNKIAQKDSDIAALESQISSYQSQLDALSKQKSSLSSSLQELDLTKKKLTADISITQNKIDRTNLAISNLSSDITTKESAINDHLESIRQEIRNVNEYEQKSLVEGVLSQDDFSAIWTDIDNLITVREKIREDIVTLQNTKGELEDTRSTTIDAKNELLKLKSQLSDQQKIVIQNANEKSRLLAQTKNNEANYQKLVADSLAKKNALQKEVSDYESQLKYILDPSALPAGGVLSWPLDSVLITNLFGKNSSGIYASGLHNGVDFRAAVGTNVKALADGIVVGSGDTDTQCPGASFGRFILIKYDNGLAATFGHLSLVKVSAGQRVSRGQVVGLSGYTGYVYPPGPGGAHLHVSVYPANAIEIKSLPSKSCPGKILTQPIAPINAYLDPLIYLPKASASMFKSTIIKPD